ncbi:MAG: hypothetical protein OEY16_02680 [Alphaproteobacteria bacterium]|jgi:hypothetical protein|nr:hypothetical protein [Alphaproteobacteria bacterium]
MDKVKAIINAGLAEVWGTDGEDGKPSETWPYELNYWGMAKGWTLYRFADGNVERYAGYDPEVGVISGPVADLTLEDMTDEFRGGDWIYQRGPIDLEEEATGKNGAIPSHEDRVAAVDALAREALGPDGEYVILRGYYLEATGGHIALIRPHRSRGEALVIGTDMKPITIGYRKATPDRRICIALARSMPA